MQYGDLKGNKEISKKKKKGSHTNESMKNKEKNIAFGRSLKPLCQGTKLYGKSVPVKWHKSDKPINKSKNAVWKTRKPRHDDKNPLQKHTKKTTGRKLATLKTIPFTSYKPKQSPHQETRKKKGKSWLSMSPEISRAMSAFCLSLQSDSLACFTISLSRRIVPCTGMNWQRWNVDHTHLIQQNAWPA